MGKNLKKGKINLFYKTKKKNKRGQGREYWKRRKDYLREKGDSMK